MGSSRRTEENPASQRKSSYRPGSRISCSQPQSGDNVVLVRIPSECGHEPGEHHYRLGGITGRLFVSTAPSDLSVHLGLRYRRLVCIYRGSRRIFADIGHVHAARLLPGITYKAVKHIVDGDKWRYDIKPACYGTTTDQPSMPPKFCAARNKRIREIQRYEFGALLEICSPWTSCLPTPDPTQLARMGQANQGPLPMFSPRNQFGSQHRLLLTLVGLPSVI